MNHEQAHRPSKFPALEELGPNDTVSHTRRRTVTQIDNSWFTLLTLNTAPHFDITTRHFDDFGGVLMNSSVTLGVIQGLALADLGETALPNRGFGEIRMTSPVFAGDTLRAESTILEKWPSNGEHGATVHVRLAGFNQRDAKVIEFDRTYILSAEGGWKREIDLRTRSAPKLSSNRVFVPQIQGPFYEDFKVGDVYDHGLGRTMFAEESIWISLLLLNTNPHYIDCEFSKGFDPRGVLIDDTFVLTAITGIGVKHTTQNAVANLGWKNVQFHVPVFSGDTLYSETEVTHVRPSKSRPGQGIVSVKTIGKNQRGEVVLSFDRAFLTRNRP